MKEDTLIVLLREVKEVLDKHGIEFWLDAGTLLGAVRNGKIIPWEQDLDFGTWDMDLSDSVKRSVAKELSNKGFKVYIYKNYMHIRHERKVWADLKFYRLIDGKAIEPKFEPVKLIGTFLSYFSTVLSDPYDYEIDFRAKLSIKNFVKIILVEISRGLPSSLRMRLAKIVTLIYKGIGSKDVSEVIPADYFRDLATMTFYGMEFRVPAKKEELLAFRYGENWRIPRRDWITSRDDGVVINTKWRKRKRS